MRKFVLSEWIKVLLLRSGTEGHHTDCGSGSQLNTSKPAPRIGRPTPRTGRPVPGLGRSLEVELGPGALPQGLVQWTVGPEQQTAGPEK